LLGYSACANAADAGKAATPPTIINLTNHERREHIMISSPIGLA
jgi:hypothetical protein